MIEVLIADDHKIILDSIRIILGFRSNIRIAAEATDGDMLMELIPTTKPHLIISDLKMGGLSGIKLVETIKSTYPHIKLIVMTMSDEDEIIQRLFLAETDGYVMKHSGKDELLLAVDNVINDKLHFDRAVMDRLMKRQRMELKREPEQPINLSTRELEVLKLIADEYTSKEIADKLFISKQTVDTHRQHIMEKTNIRTLAGVVKLAVRLGLSE